MCNKNVTIDEIAVHKYSHASWWFVVIFVPLITACGVISNCALIFVVYRVQSMRNVTNVYLVNLAVADSSLLLAAFAQYIGDYAVSPEYDLRFSFNTVFGCAVPNFLIYLCYYASLWTVTLVSFERYLAICHTFWHRLVNSKTRAIRMVGMVWIVSLGFAILSLPYKPVKICIKASDSSTNITQHVPYCEFSCQWCACALYLTDSAQFFIALVSNVVMYMLIVCRLSKSQLSMDKNNCAKDKSRAVRTRNAVAKMLVLNGVIFFICLAPFSIANLESIARNFHGSIFKRRFVNHLGWVGRVLFLINSALNPLVYNVSNQRYRMAFRQALGFRQSIGLKESVRHYQSTSIKNTNVNTCISTRETRI